MKQRVGILISGRGSNMAALIEAAREPGYPAEIVLVLSNKPDAPGLRLARDAGISAVAIDHRHYGPDRSRHEAVVDQALRDARVTIVCCAGYMRLLSPYLVGSWRGRMLNIHPSLLPAFPGLHTHARALEAGVKLHGCTVHLVTEQMDSGPILAQAAVPVLTDDTEVSLGARVLEQEHVIFPAALSAFCGRGGPPAPARSALLNPLPWAAAVP